MIVGNGMNNFEYGLVLDGRNLFLKISFQEKYVQQSLAVLNDLF